MRILIVSAYFYPEITPRAFRTTELAKELVRQHHSVTVYIPQSGNDYKDLLKEYPMQIKYLPRHWKTMTLGKGKVWTIIARIVNRLAGLFFNYPTIEFKYSVPKTLKREKRKYDLLISIAVPHSIHWGVTKALKNNPKLTHKWIADCGDPFMGCKTDSFKKMFYFKYLEKEFCRRADYITIPVKEGICGYYPEFHEKIKIIPQGFSFSHKSEKKNVFNTPITFAYAGGFIPGIRDPRPLLDLLQTIDIEFKFLIYTNNYQLIEPYKKILGNKLVVSSYIPRNELLEILSNCDFLLNLENGTKVQSPSKLIDYALANRPILSLNSQKLDIRLLKSFLNHDYTQQLVIQEIEKYDIKNVARQFVNLV